MREIKLRWDYKVPGNGNLQKSSENSREPYQKRAHIKTKA
jgi:hypothetical protein